MHFKRVREASVAVGLLGMIALSSPAPTCAGTAGSILVRDLKGQDLAQGKAVLLTDLVVSGLQASGAFEKVYARSDLEEMLAQQGDRQRMDPNCDTTACMLEVGNALGAGRVLSGNVGRLGNLFVVTLTVYRIATSGTESRRTWECECSEQDLAAKIRGYALEVVGLETSAPRDARVAAEQRPAADGAAADQKAPAAAGAQPEGDELLRRLGLEFVRIPGGEFEMGTNEFAWAKPVHRVRVTAFSIARTEVTQAQWAAVMGSNPSRFKGCDDCPVETVSWTDVQEFLRKVDAQTGLSVRLPTEAEWEYAARGGAAQQKYAGMNNDNELGDYAWFSPNAGGTTHSVCQKRPNLFGLCDMSGNVGEWCSDWYGNGYYLWSPANNPAGSSGGVHRVYRGGSWNDDARLARAANRSWDGPSFRLNYLGFRLVVP